MVIQNRQVEILFSMLYSHSFPSTLVFERNIKPITAPAQGSALCVQNIQIIILDDFSTVLTQHFGKSFFHFPSSPKTIKLTDPCKNILAVQSQQALHVIFAVHQHLVTSEKQMFPCFPSDKFVKCAANLPLPSLAPATLSVMSTKYLISSKQTSQTPARLRNNRSASKGG